MVHCLSLKNTFLKGLGVFLFTLSSFALAQKEEVLVKLEVAQPGTESAGLFRLTLVNSPHFNAEQVEMVRGGSATIFGVFPDPNSQELDYLGRFSGNPENIALHVRLKDGQIHKIQAKVAESQTEKDTVAFEKAWAKALLSDYVQKATRQDSSFYQYAALTTAKRFGLEKELQELDKQVDVFNNPFRTTPDLYSVFTGAAAIQETLQLDMMRQLNLKEEKYRVDASTLKGPTIQSHPFEEMLGDREYKQFPLSRYAPQEFYYLHATSVNNILNLESQLKDWGRHLLRHYMASGREFQLKEQYQNQLAIKVDPFSRMFYGMVIRSMAVVGSDLYLAEGSDVTLIFHLKNRNMFHQRIMQYRQAFEQSTPGTTKEQWYHLGMSVEGLSTPNRKLSSFLCYPEENIAIISNSRVALRRVLEAGLRKEGNLQESTEFKYMRSIFPASDEKESVFVYLSDPFIRNLVGPKSKILEQRRVRAVNSLYMIQNASLLHLLEKGTAPHTLEELIGQKYLEEKHLYSPFEGNFSLANEGPTAGLTGESSSLGSNGTLTPILEMEFEKVSARERMDYQRFVGNYNGYWREFFDPIGIRIQLNEGLKVETVILPLINNSIYNNLTNLIGGDSVELDAGAIPKNTIFLARIKSKNILSNLTSLPFSNKCNKEAFWII